MRRLTATLLCAALAGAPAAARAQPLPQEPALSPYTATYSVSRGRMRVGQMEVTLTRTERGSWLYQSHSRTTGVIGFLRDYRIHETTRFRIVQDVLVPYQHVYTLTGDRRDRNFALVFDWVRREVRGIVEGEAASGELVAGAVDRHTVLLATMLDVRNGRQFPYRLDMVDRARVKPVEVRLDGDEELRTPAGKFRTLRIVQQRIDDPEKRLMLSLAVDHRHLPVRVRSVDDEGKTVTLELLEFSFH